MKVLMFEDDELLQSMYVTKYKRSGADVVTYGNPSLDPVSIVLKEHPDIISMDVVMPIMDGFQALEKIKADARTKDIPVILLTSLGQAENIQKGLALGATEYLIKSQYMPGQVVNRFRKVLGLPQFDFREPSVSPAEMQQKRRQQEAAHVDPAVVPPRNTQVMGKQKTLRTVSWVSIAYSILAILFGAFLVGFGGYDDSPGAQGIGVLLVILGIVVLVKVKRKQPRA